MTETYRAALVGCSRMGAFIDNESHKSVKPVPFSHAACYEACPRTELVTCVDIRREALDQAGECYGVPAAHRYTDFRQMLAEEKPDIVSVATQPEQRTEIVLAAIESGVKAVYAEKAMAASMAEADAVVTAVEENEVAFNMGTNRRWELNYDGMFEAIHSGEYGALKSIIAHSVSTLFNMGSHAFDIMLRLNGESPAVAVQARLDEPDDLFDGHRMLRDPYGQGTVMFENGVTGYGLNSGAGWMIEAVCEGAVIQGDPAWEIRMPDKTMPLPDVEVVSSGVRLVEELAEALDSGTIQPRGGVRTARASNELIFGFVESHRRGGEIVELPLASSEVRLDRPFDPKQPKYQKS